MNANVQRFGSAAGLGLALVVAVATVQAQEPKKEGTPAVLKKNDRNRDLDGKPAPKSLQTGEGVIVKVDVLGSERKKEDRRLRRIEINQNAIWRDWVRDQASVNDVQRANTAAAAEKGKTSVATVGQPKSEDGRLVIEVPADAKVETRFRSATDEASQGAPTPGQAGTAEKAVDAFDKSAKAKEKNAPKPKANPSPAAPGTLHSDLKSGLFVEVEYTAKKGVNVASRVRILRPVGGANTPADQAEPK